MVKDKYAKTKYGIGFMGEGEYNYKNHKEAHVRWSKMFERCYNPKYSAIFPTYIDCEVSDEWHNFQNFAKWWYDNIYEYDKMLVLDKDLICKNNKIYSKETCCIIPSHINALLTSCNSRRGNLPVGVSINEGRYMVTCSINGKNKNLGRYNSINEAFNVYKNFKEKLIKSIAEEYKNIISKEAYEGLLRYEINIED